MWIVIGFVVGAWLGVVSSFGFLVGGVLGAAAGAVFAAQRRGAFGGGQAATEARLAAVESELKSLRAEFAALRRRMQPATDAQRATTAMPGGAAASPPDPMAAAIRSDAAESSTGAVAVPAGDQAVVPPVAASIPANDLVARLRAGAEPARAAAAGAPIGAATDASGDPSVAAATAAADATRDSGKPAAGGTLDELFDRARGWLFGGNTVVRVGLLVLFFGFAFLARYAVEHALLPIELRLAAVAAGGIALLLTGWRLRDKRAGYAMSMQGGGVAVLYLTVFAALRLYALLPPAFAFALLLAIVALAAVLAIVQNAPALAIIGTAGGFMAPILASTGHGDHVALFTYYTLLNLGVLAIAWKKAWRALNLTGFAFTFAIALAWGARDYRPELFASSEPFLIGFFLMYVAAAVLYAWRQAPQLRHYVDGGLVFGTPVVAFGLQAALCQHIEYALAWSALAVGGFYVLLARWLLARRRDSLRLLVEAFLALGVAFLTLAIPLALDGRWTAAAWALEGAALLWVGARQSRKLAIAAGLLLQLGAGVFFASENVGGARFDEAYARALPFANAQFVGAAMIACAGFFAARVAFLHRATVDAVLRFAGPALLAWATLWWLGGGIAELDAWLSKRDMPAATLLLFAASAALAGWTARRLAWDALHAVALLAVPGMAISLAGSLGNGASPAAGWGIVAWVAAVAAHLWTARQAEPVEYLQRVLSWAHVGGLWLATAALAWMAGAAVEARVDADSWSFAAALAAPLAVVHGLLWADRRALWPLSHWQLAYLRTGAGGFVAGLLAAVLFANIIGDGRAAPLPYLPILNPLELALVAALFTALRWWQLLTQQQMLESPTAERAFPALLAGLAFLLANGVLLRTLHHATGVNWDGDALFASDTVQMSLALFWALLGLVLTFLASRSGRRVVWIAGAALLGLVVAKLFLIDMANTGTVARIVSFLGAGVLLVIVGYLSPLPPAREARP
jgi:uncharacterized membrane protein